MSLRHYQKRKKKNYPLYRAIRKYGKDNFKIDVLRDDIKSKNHLFSLERFEIKKRNLVKHGYNASAGGEIPSNMQEFEFRGVWYPSKVSLTSKFNVKENTFSQRLDYGYSVEEALGLKKREIIKYTVYGKNFDSAKSAAVDYKVNYSTVRARLQKGYSIEQALGIEEIDQKPGKGGCGYKYKIDDKVYNSRKELADEFNISLDNIHARFQRGWTLKQVVGLEKKPHVQANGSKAISISGIKYNSIADAAKAHNIKYATFRRRLYKGWSPEEAAGVKDRVMDNAC